MALHRGIGDSEPVGPASAASVAGASEQRLRASVWTLATGTLACPACDAPVAPGGPLSPSDRVACPYCAHPGALRDFLSLAAPARPARVEVRVVLHRSAARG